MDVVPLTSPRAKLISGPKNSRSSAKIDFFTIGTFPTAFVLEDVRSWGAGSTGRRNTGVKSLCWGFKLQGLTWPFVELTSHFVQIGLRMHRQVGTLRKVLSQQTIGVLIRAALPWALRIAKINVDVCRQIDPDKTISPRSISFFIGGKLPIPQPGSD